MKDLKASNRENTFEACKNIDVRLTVSQNKWDIENNLM